MRSGRWLVFGAAFFWGTSATLARFVFRDHHVPALTVVELRLAIAAAMLGPWLACRQPWSLRVERRDWGYFVVLGLFGLAAVQGSYYYSISVIGVGLAILVQYLAPSLVVLYDLVHGRRVGARTIAGVLGALAGTVLLVGNLGTSSPAPKPIHWAISFCSALTFAFYLVYSKRGLVRYAPETVLFYTFCIAGTFWALVTPPWRIVAAGYAPGLWALFMVLAVVSTLVPFTLFYAGLRRMPATQVGTIATLEPVIAVASAAVFLGEGLRPAQTIGAVLVLAAAALASSPRPDASLSLSSLPPAPRRHRGAI